MESSCDSGAGVCGETGSGGGGRVEVTYCGTAKVVMTAVKRNRIQAGRRSRFLCATVGLLCFDSSTERDKLKLNDELKCCESAFNGNFNFYHRIILEHFVKCFLGRLFRESEH